MGQVFPVQLHWLGTVQKHLTTMADGGLKSGLQSICQATHLDWGNIHGVAMTSRSCVPWTYKVPEGHLFLMTERYHMG